MESMMIFLEDKNKSQGLCPKIANRKGIRLDKYIQNRL